MFTEIYNPKKYIFEALEHFLWSGPNYKRVFNVYKDIFYARDCIGKKGEMNKLFHQWRLFTR